MKRKFFIVAFALTIAFAFLYISIHNNKTNYIADADMLRTALESSEATGLSKEFYCFAKLEYNYTFTELEEYIDSISKKLGIDKDDESYRLENTANDIYRTIQVNGVTGSSDLVNVSCHIVSDDKGENQSYLTVNVTGDYDEGGLLEIKRKVVSFMEDKNLDFKDNLSLTGYINGKLDSNELNNTFRKVFNSAGAKKVEGIKDNNLISLSAYSPNVKNFISVNGNRVNLNVAIRYNSYEDKTYIWLATPVITKEY